MPPLQSGFFGLRWSYVQNTHNNIHSLSYSTVNTWNALVLLRSDVPSRDIAFRRGFWLFPASPVINDDTTRDRDRDKDRAAVCSTGSWWPWLDDAEMVPGAIKRRKVDLDFYLHRIFRKTSFRFVPLSTVLHEGEDWLLFYRPLQREVITAAVENNDVFLQASTSFGKSLCFQLPAVVSNGGWSTILLGTVPVSWDSSGW